VILVDANLLIYASVSSVPEHQRARAWLDKQLAGPGRVGLPWPSLLAYLRITTSRRIFAHAQSIENAWTQICEWLDQPPAWIPQPTEHHAAILHKVCEAAGASADLVSDAHLAALAIEHGLTICTNDRDFARFPDLRWINPLTQR
jgi:toxin-antitoxin system PIN domain toxin